MIYHLLMDLRGVYKKTGIVDNPVSMKVDYVAFIMVRLLGKLRGLGLELEVLLTLIANRGNKANLIKYPAECIAL